MAQNEYFIDTNAFMALIYEDDQYHDEAVEIQEGLDRKEMGRVTTDYVLTEVYAFLISRVGRFAADLFDQALQGEGNLTIVFQGKAGFRNAQELFRQYSDKDYSLVDWASFATMQERGLSNVFNFRHFGFQIMGTV